MGKSNRTERYAMIKKWFDWTPRDVAAWEKIRARGPWKFFLWYGVGVTGGGLFLLLGILSLLSWLKDSLLNGIAAAVTTYLLMYTAFLAILALAGGLVISLITWLMEDTIYRRVYLPKKAGLTEGDSPEEPQK